MTKQLIQIVNVIALNFLLAGAGISSAKAGNNNLTDQITRLLNNTINLPASVRPILSVQLLTPDAQLARLCANPTLSLSGNLSRLTGTHSIIAQCEAQRRFLQIKVNATGRWWQAARPLKPGDVLTLQDIQPQQGSLNHLPGGLIFDRKNIIDRVALRPIHPGEKLVESQLRQRWAITAGDKVEISYQGAGFKIRITAKALDNAALNQRLRLKTASGQILSATAIGDDKAAVKVD